jgi:hypothetical protein
VTSNTRHFPAGARDPYGIDVHTPDEFLAELWDISPETMARVLAEQARALHRPPTTIFELVKNLGRALPSFADLATQSDVLQQAWEQADEAATPPDYRPL